MFTFSSLTPAGVGARARRFLPCVLAHSRAVTLWVGGLPGRVRVTWRRTRRLAGLLPPAWQWAMALVLFLGVAVRHEIRTSALQSRLLSTLASRASYQVDVGPSPNAVFPNRGPFDIRRGYALLPEFRRRLAAGGYDVMEQARFSGAAALLARRGIPLPYREAPMAGLVIRDAHGSTLYDARPSDALFRRFEEIPPLVVGSLLFIENRDLLDPIDSRCNPAVDWGRLTKAIVLYAGRRAGLPVRLEGGSTLATQIEKYRHSGGGRTWSPLDKVRQMTAASLRVYREGPDTLSGRRQIVVDYLNTMPLAATPAHGEVFGLGEGLRAWFGMNPREANRALLRPESSDDKAADFKHVLALLYAVRAPSHYLGEDRAALEEKVDAYTSLLEKAGLIDAELARRVRGTPLRFAAAVAGGIAPAAHRTAKRGVRGSLGPDAPGGADRGAISFADHKAAAAIREDLRQSLGLPGLYELDRLDLQIESTIDADLQNEVTRLFRRLKDPLFLEANGLREPRLLSSGDPNRVVYSLLLIERGPQVNLVRVHADSLDEPFDVNEGMKLELGSTAKLRTLAHYLEIVARLHEELSGLPPRALRARTLAARDPITRWAAQTLLGDARLGPDAFLDRALDRPYSASPGEVFFTGGGEHLFHNFEADDGRVLTVREALIRSTNLVFIRLMRDVVRYHEVRLPYDTLAVLADPHHPDRRRLLEEVAEAESGQTLSRACREYRDRTPAGVVRRLLGDGGVTARRLAVVFYAWHPGSDEDALGRWLRQWIPRITPGEVRRLAGSYGNPRLTLADFGYLLGRHPLEVWCAGELLHAPDLSCEDRWERSGEARRVSSAWLFETRNRAVQDLRLRMRFEEDAFAAMTPDWRRLGFPFEKLVPSYATAIGSSSDRPAALAELMGIIVNDGLRLPTRQVLRLRFGQETPYHTVFEQTWHGAGERVTRSSVARALRGVLAQAVEQGTARRVSGAFRTPGGLAVVTGGKTGSGDNRFKTFARGGQMISSRAVSRTAAFVFYIGDRYFGVVTASVSGPEAHGYPFTSSLPLAVLKLLAPAINRRLTSRPGVLQALGDPFRPATASQGLLQGHQDALDDSVRFRPSSQGHLVVVPERQALSLLKIPSALSLLGLRVGPGDTP